MAIDTPAKRTSMLTFGRFWGPITLPIPNGAYDDADRQHLLACYSGIAFASVVWTTVGGIFLFTSANWSESAFYLETYIKAAAGTAYARLYDVTDTSPVTDSDVSTTSASLVRLRSSAMTLTDGKEYVAQIGVEAGDSGNVRSVKIIRIEA